jgi:hypothetical protein
MNNDDLERFEAELRRIEPAPLPEELRGRLLNAKPSEKLARSAAPRRAISLPLWLQALRWVATAASVVLIAIVGWNAGWRRAGHTPREVPAAETAGLKADDVQIRRDLISDFDAVARLPGGEPVRFRCRKWMDQVTVRDKYRGLIVAQTSPRVEVVPVGFETY